MTLPLSTPGGLADGSHVGRHARTWSIIQRSTRNHQNEGKTHSLGYMLYLAYAVLGVCCTQCELMITAWRHGEGWLNCVLFDVGGVVDEKERDRTEDENNVENMGRNEKSGVQLVRLSSKYLRSEWSHAGSGPLLAISGMVCWLTSEILLDPSFSWLFPPSPLIAHFRVLYSIITYEHNLESLIIIPPCHDQGFTPSWAYTEYCIIPWLTILHSQQVFHLPPPSLFYSILYIPTIMSSPMNSVSAHFCDSHQIYHLQIDCLAIDRSQIKCCQTHLQCVMHMT